MPAPPLLEDAFLRAQWHAEAFDAKRLVRLLLDLRATAEPALRDRILALDAETAALDAALDAAIADREAGMNALVYRLYGLSPEEIVMVEGG